MPRLPSDDLLDVDLAALEAYFDTRSRQTRHDGFRREGPIESSHGCPWARFARGEELFCSIYIPTPLRGQGLLRAIQAEVALPIVTVGPCSIGAALAKMNLPHAMAGQILESVEYRLIESFYGDRRARRSGVFFQNHIDEGLAVMKAWGASEQAMRAFCLHPLVQLDPDLSANFSRVADAMAPVPTAPRSWPWPWNIAASPTITSPTRRCRPRASASRRSKKSTTCSWATKFKTAKTSTATIWASIPARRAWMNILGNGSRRSGPPAAKAS